MIACRTTIAQYSTPDVGPQPIPSTRRCMLPPSQHYQLATMTSPSLAPPWLLAFRREFPALFKSRLGHCSHYLISSLPFKFPLPLNQQPHLAISRPIENCAVLQELLMLVRLGTVRETTQEPYVIPEFCVSKKNGQVQLVSDFRKFNSCV